MLPCLTLSIIRYRSRVKWSNPGNGVAPSPIPQCCSYWKGSLWVALDKGRQLYLLTYDMCMYCFEQVFEATPHKTASVRSPTFLLKNHPSKRNKTCGTLLLKQRTHILLTLSKASTNVSCVPDRIHCETYSHWMYWPEKPFKLQMMWRSCSEKLK